MKSARKNAQSYINKLMRHYKSASLQEKIDYLHGMVDILFNLTNCNVIQKKKFNPFITALINVLHELLDIYKIFLKHENTRNIYSNR